MEVIYDGEDILWSIFAILNLASVFPEELEL